MRGEGKKKKARPPQKERMEPGVSSKRPSNFHKREQRVDRAEISYVVFALYGKRRKEEVASGQVVDSGTKKKRTRSRHEERGKRERCRYGRISSSA